MLAAHSMRQIKMAAGLPPLAYGAALQESPSLERDCLMRCPGVYHGGTELPDITSDMVLGSWHTPSKSQSRGFQLMLAFLNTRRS